MSGSADCIDERFGDKVSHPLGSLVDGGRCAILDAKRVHAILAWTERASSEAVR